MPIPRDEFFRRLTEDPGALVVDTVPAVSEAERLVLEVLRRAPGDFHSVAELVAGIAAIPYPPTELGARLAVYVLLERALGRLTADGEVEAYVRGDVRYFAARHWHGMGAGPTTKEIAGATEAARDADGPVDPFALIEALSVPVGGVVRSDG